MSLNLTHIPCPAGNSCTAFQCIFGHARDKAPTPAAGGDAKGSAQAQKPRDVPSKDQDRPQKRVKLDASVDSEPQSGLARTSKEGAASHVLGVQTLKTATRSISPPAISRPSGSATLKAKAVSSTASKTSQLSTKPKASTPKPAVPPKPAKAESLNPRLLKSSPASHEIRLKLVKLLHQQYTRLNAELKKDANDEERKLVLTEQQLITRTLDEEQLAAIEKSAVYTNVMKNKVMQYKRTTISQWKDQRTKEVQAAQKKRRQSDLSDGKPVILDSGLTPAQDVQLLKRILTPINDLASHGYVPVVPSEEQVKRAREGLDAAKGWEKCDRCQQRFQVFPGRREEDGALTTGGPCNFHWGKTYVPDKLPGERTRVPKRYHCCGQEVGDSAGCFTHENHVYKASDPKRLSAVMNFAKTPDSNFAPPDRAVCFDCEMCYTVHGLELVRLTATSWPTGVELLDVLVQPLGEILDLNSRFSGVWPEDLARAESWSFDDDDSKSKPSKSGEETGSEDGEVQSRKKLKIVSSPEVARDLLFSLLSPSTPLIGHGLENDLNAVRIVHPTLIDTVILYPHRAGLPFRYGLKTLMDQHLNRKIQQETGPKMLGHDSAEDARAAGDLVRLKVLNEWKDMQRLGWKLEDGEMVAPQGKDGGLTEAFIEPW